MRRFIFPFELLFSLPIMEILNFEGVLLSQKYLPRKYRDNKSLAKLNRFTVLWGSFHKLLRDVTLFVMSILISKHNSSLLTAFPQIQRYQILLIFFTKVY